MIFKGPGRSLRSRVKAQTFWIPFWTTRDIVPAWLNEAGAYAIRQISGFLLTNGRTNGRIQVLLKPRFLTREPLQGNNCFPSTGSSRWLHGQYAEGHESRWSNSPVGISSDRRLSVTTFWAWVGLGTVKTKLGTIGYGR